MCENQIGTFTCHCQKGFTGPTCEYTMFKPHEASCKHNMCKNGGTCSIVRDSGQAICNCLEGLISWSNKLLFLQTLKTNCFILWQVNTVLYITIEFTKIKKQPVLDINRYFFYLQIFKEFFAINWHGALHLTFVGTEELVKTISVMLTVNAKMAGLVCFVIATWCKVENFVIILFK